MRKMLEEAAKYAAKQPFPTQLRLGVSGICTKMTNPAGIIHEHWTSWLQLEEAHPGVNPLLFALAHCKRKLDQLNDTEPQEASDPHANPSRDANL